MSNMQRVPDFFVVGAQKAGTTTLHDRLAECTPINLPFTKETHFFSDDDNYAKGLGWYLRQYPAGQDFTRRGEIAPDYLFSPAAPARIRAVNPAPDIVCLFRQPLERAYSNYLMAVRNGYETLAFSDALAAEEERAATSPRHRALYSYLGRSLYGQQVRRYQDTLPEARYLFLKFEDFTDPDGQGQQTFEEICRFIGLDPRLVEVDYEAKSNVASQPRSTFLRNQLYQASRIKRVLRLLIPSRDLRARIAYRLDRLNQRPIEKPPIGRVPDRIIEKLLADLDLLQALTGLDLTPWKDGISAHNQGK